MDQLCQAVSIIWVFTGFCEIVKLVSFHLMQVIYIDYCYRASSDLNLMPGEVVAILHKAKCYLG